MGRISHALMIQVVGTAAWLFAGAMARPGAAQEPPPTAPAPSYADLVAPEGTVQPTGAVPSYAPISPRIEMGLLDTITESLFGDVYAEGRWRPLPLSTFFSEGWFEPWAAAPSGREGLTPRHGWLASFDGVFYRLWFATFGYSNSINTSFGGNRYLGTYSIFLPFSRRFEVLFDVPFVVSNGTKDPTRGYTS